jgi:hypothetical protein
MSKKVLLGYVAMYTCVVLISCQWHSEPFSHIHEPRFSLMSSWKFRRVSSLKVAKCSCFSFKRRKSYHKDREADSWKKASASNKETYISRQPTSKTQPKQFDCITFIQFLAVKLTNFLKSLGKVMNFCSLKNYGHLTVGTNSTTIGLDHFEDPFVLYLVSLIPDRSDYGQNWGDLGGRTVRTPARAARCPCTNVYLILRGSRFAFVFRPADIETIE